MNEMKIVVEKTREGFLTLDGNFYKDVKPVKPEESPIILNNEEV